MTKIFNSENYLGKNKKNYFEGWYFRHSGEFPFAFIIGISKSKKSSHSFVQYIDTQRSEYFSFPEEALTFDKDGMRITVGENTFSQKGIKVNICREGREVKADLEYRDMVRFKKSVYTPSVMGPFSYLPMPCNHSLISLTHSYFGTLSGGRDRQEVSGRGYIEKDFGSSFPENYFWMHAESGGVSVMCAVAWPLPFKMRGFLCIMYSGGKQYNLSLYTGAKIEKFQAERERVELTLSRGGHRISICAQSGEGEQKLIAPAEGGKMNTPIKENLNGKLAMSLTLCKKTVDFPKETDCAFECVLSGKRE